MAPRIDRKNRISSTVASSVTTSNAAKGCVSVDLRGGGNFDKGPGFSVQGSGFSVLFSGCKVRGSGFRVKSSGSRVEGFKNTCDGPADRKSPGGPFHARARRRVPAP